jgi:hypothetical protein
MGLRVRVELTDDDITHAHHIGTLRLQCSGNVNRNPHRSQTGRTTTDRLRHDQQGAVGELALCRHLRRDWHASVNRFHNRPDVPIPGQPWEGFDVTTTTLDHGCLILRDNDALHRRFVLITTHPTNPQVVWLRGWITGHDGTLPEYLKAPNGDRQSWFVPQQALRPIDELDGLQL